MKRNLILSAMLIVGTYAMACTNFIVGKKASVDGSVFVTYNADSYGAFMPLYHYPAAKHAAGEMRKVCEWDTGKYLGEIAEAAETYNVIGNSNEWQVTVGETTFGGREEMADSTGIIDYGSLIYIALHREALQIMTSLVEQYGYYSEGETFSIADPNEAWILEMMGCGPDRTKSKERTVWVAVRIPDNAIAAHANQSRITKFLDGRYLQVKMQDLQKKYPVNGKKPVPNLMVCSDNVVSYARAMGWFEGKDVDFSYNAAMTSLPMCLMLQASRKTPRRCLFGLFPIRRLVYRICVMRCATTMRELPSLLIQTSVVVSTRCLIVRHRFLIR